MADDLKYGYKGAEPTQSFGNNTGVFDPNDINNLIADNKWTTFGQLELIETQTVTSTVSTVEFTDIKSSIYNVHLWTYNNAQVTDGNKLAVRFGANSSSYLTSGYQYASQYGFATGGFGGLISTSVNYLWDMFGYNGNTGNQTQNGYAYFYNLGDSTKYNFATSHSFGFEATSNSSITIFGSGVQTTAQSNNAIEISSKASGSILQGDFSLYGIRYS